MGSISGGGESASHSGVACSAGPGLGGQGVCSELIKWSQLAQNNIYIEIVLSLPHY